MQTSPFLKGNGGVYKGQKSHKPVGVQNSSSSKLGWRKFQVYHKYHWNKETYYYKLLMDYLMSL